MGPTGILPVDLFFRYIVDILRYFKLKAVSFKLIKNNRQSGSDRRRTGADFDLQPTLKGELIELRPLRQQDFDALFSAASDPKIWEQHPESDRYQREVFQRFFDGAFESKGAFAIIERNRAESLEARDIAIWI